MQIVSENLLAGKIVRIPARRQPMPNRSPTGGELATVVQPDLLEGIAQAAGKLNRLLHIDVDSAMQPFRKSEGAPAR